MRPHSQSRTGLPIPLPSGSTGPGTSKGTVGPLCGQCTLAADQNPPDPFSLGCSLASCTLFCTNIHGCSIPGALSGTCSYQTSYDLRLPNSPILSRPFCKVPLSSREFYTNAFFSPKITSPTRENYNCLLLLTISSISSSKIMTQEGIHFSPLGPALVLQNSYM